MQSTVIAAHIALPQSMIDEASNWVMAWRAIRLASPPAELLGARPHRGTLAAQLAARGNTVGVLPGVDLSIRVLATAAG
ncbi:hypothetical protein [Roseomonas sp. WA12]